jgi:hypothetical protein
MTSGVLVASLACRNVGLCCLECVRHFSSHHSKIQPCVASPELKVPQFSSLDCHLAAFGRLLMISKRLVLTTFGWDHGTSLSTIQWCENPLLSAIMHRLRFAEKEVVMIGQPRTARLGFLQGVNPGLSGYQAVHSIGDSLVSAIPDSLP